MTMFTSKPPTCAGRTLALPRKDRDIRYLRPLGNSDIARFFAWISHSTRFLGRLRQLPVVEAGAEAADHRLRMFRALVVAEVVVGQPECLGQLYRTRRFSIGAFPVCRPITRSKGNTVKGSPDQPHAAYAFGNDTAATCRHST